MASIQQRLDTVLDRIARLGATATKVVLSEADMSELGGKQGASYRNVPVEVGQVGGSSYVEASGTPSGETSFAID